MDRIFEGATVLITGGGTGIGRAAALALAPAGCTVTVAGRTESTLEETVGMINEAGAAARLVQCDGADEESVVHAVEVAVGDSGRLDFGVNSAGISGGDDLRKLADCSVEAFDHMIAVDLRGTFLSMKYQLRQMETQGFGSLVNVGSGASVVGVPGFAGYAAAKHGVIRLTRTAALDYGPDGIRVNALAVCVVNTPLIAEGRSRGRHREGPVEVAPDTQVALGVGDVGEAAPGPPGLRRPRDDAGTGSDRDGDGRLIELVEYTH